MEKQRLSRKEAEVLAQFGGLELPQTRLKSLVRGLTEFQNEMDKLNELDLADVEPAPHTSVWRV